MAWELLKFTACLQSNTSANSSLDLTSATMKEMSRKKQHEKQMYPKQGRKEKADKKWGKKVIINDNASIQSISRKMTLR